LGLFVYALLATLFVAFFMTLRSVHKELRTSTYTVYSPMSSIDERKSPRSEGTSISESSNVGLQSPLLDNKALDQQASNQSRQRHLLFSAFARYGLINFFLAPHIMRIIY
jgi:hypothetical protein